MCLSKSSKDKNKAIEILARRKERIVQTLLRRQHHRTGYTHSTRKALRHAVITGLGKLRPQPAPQPLTGRFQAMGKPQNSICSWFHERGSPCLARLGSDSQSFCLCFLRAGWQVCTPVLGGLHKAREVGFFLLNCYSTSQLGTNWEFTSLSAFHCCDKMLEILSLEGRKFILAHSLGGSSPWSVSHDVLGVWERP